MTKFTLTRSVAAMAVVCTLFSFVAFTNAWTVFKSDEGRFSISFPKEPTAQEQDLPTALGNLKLKMFSYDASNDNESNQFYMTSYIDYPDTAVNADIYTKEDMETFYNEALNGAASNVEGTLSGKKTIMIGKHEGREVKITFPSGGVDYVMNIRVFLIKNRIYMNQTISEKSKDNNANIKTFMNSFKLL